MSQVEERNPSEISTETLSPSSLALPSERTQGNQNSTETQKKPKTTTKKKSVGASKQELAPKPAKVKTITPNPSKTTSGQNSAEANEIVPPNIVALSSNNELFSIHEEGNITVLPEFGHDFSFL